MSRFQHQHQPHAGGSGTSGSTTFHSAGQQAGFAYDGDEGASSLAPLGTSTLSTSPTDPSSLGSTSSLSRPKPTRLRSRTSTIVRASPLAVNNPADPKGPAAGAGAGAMADFALALDAGPSRLPALALPDHHQPGMTGGGGRKASKSVSVSQAPSRPTLAPGKRTLSYHHSQQQQQQQNGPAVPIPNILVSESSDAAQPRRVKGKTSASSLRWDEQEDVRFPAAAKQDGGEQGGAAKGKGKKDGSRARSTSTSYVVPSSSGDGDAGKGAPVSAPPGRFNLSIPVPQVDAARWSHPYSAPPVTAEQSQANTLLTSAYNSAESAFLRLTSLVRPSRPEPSRRNSDESDKGVDSAEERVDGEGSLDSLVSRGSVDSTRRGKNWMFWSSSSSSEGDGYFSLPATPTEEVDQAFGGMASLPTPALSTASLSKGDSRSKRFRKAGVAQENAKAGWLPYVLGSMAGFTRGQTGEVLRELGWTVGILSIAFVVTLGLVVWMVKSMPITQLKHIPKSTTDLQLLSAEIRSYMASAESGWWHTIGVITFVGCWKHAWSVPGAVILNILVGSILEPIPALILLTIITASGSLGSYLLSRPLAPLIAVLFPKPLAMVRAALAPDQVPVAPSAHSHPHESNFVTPLQLSDPASRPIGGESAKPNVWRRLLIMRAMGFVPWSGMNVACGVVGVEWKTFWLTTAAGSASWSYVTASVGNLVSRLAIPQAALASASSGFGEDDLAAAGAGGQSITALLRDPVLIAKLVFLTLITLLPVFLKRRGQADPAMEEIELLQAQEGHEREIPTPAMLAARLQMDAMPNSPLVSSLARFTPTPAAFDLLSLGRRAMRSGMRGVGMVGRALGVGGGA